MDLLHIKFDRSYHPFVVATGLVVMKDSMHMDLLHIKFDSSYHPFVGAGFCGNERLCTTIMLF